MAHQTLLDSTPKTIPITMAIAVPTRAYPADVAADRATTARKSLLSSGRIAAEMNRSTCVQPPVLTTRPRPAVACQNDQQTSTAISPSHRRRGHNPDTVAVCERVRVAG